jgi:hypothetical protein
VQQGIQTLINTVHDAVYALTSSGSLLQQINGAFQSLGQLTGINVSNVSINGNNFGATVNYSGSDFQASFNYNSANGASGSGTLTFGGTTVNVSYSGSTGLSGSVVSGGTKVSLNYNGPQNYSGSVTFSGANNISLSYSSTSGASATWSSSDGTFSASAGGAVRAATSVLRSQFRCSRAGV